jgi:hypothetical protein
VGQQGGIETLAAIAWERGAVPDVCLAGQETHAQVQPTDELLVEGDPAVGDESALASPNITMPAQTKTLQDWRGIGELHRGGQFSGNFRANALEDRRDARLHSSRKRAVEPQRPEQAHVLSVRFRR